MQTITELERVAAGHWRGTEEEWLGDWLLRAAGGFTGRANSALPLGDPGVPLDEALAAVSGWYRARGLPPVIAVAGPLEAGPLEAGPPEAGPGLDGALARRGWSLRPGPALVMVASLPLPAGPPPGPPPGLQVRVADQPGDEWAAMYHYRGQDHLPPVARAVLASAEFQSFVSIWSGGEIGAIARVSVAGGWAGITAVEVAPGRRRQGLGAAVTRAACEQAGRRGVSRVFLQVETGNAPARALYERLGFRYSHRYHYRIAP